MGHEDRHAMAIAIGWPGLQMPSKLWVHEVSSYTTWRWIFRPIEIKSGPRSRRQDTLNPLVYAVKDSRGQTGTRLTPELRTHPHFGDFIIY
jgi:hypothetical protein